MAGHQMDEAKGRVKEAAGTVTGDHALKDEGRADQASASVKRGIDRFTDGVKDVLNPRRRRRHGRERY